MVLLLLIPVFLPCLIITGLASNEDKRLILEKEPDLDLAAEINKLRSQLLEQQKILDGLGSTYVRWGSTVCPFTATALYNGYIAGRYHTGAGSGGNNICLPSNPSWLKYTDGVRSDRRAYIYGTEIDSLDNPEIFSYSVNEQDLPCVVCQNNRSSTLMVPARIDCFANWTFEYRGYLVAGLHGDVGNEYICLEENPEFVQHGVTSDDQHILYLTEGRCGSLPCPPYVEGRELACVVCSK